MSLVDLFDAVFGPLCAQFAAVFNQLTASLSLNYDFTNVCTVISDALTAFLTSLSI